MLPASYAVPASAVLVIGGLLACMAGYRLFGELPDRWSAAGAGLGLTIARHFVEAHGGKLWATSEPGFGSIFFVSLPIHTMQERS